jgi:hypothetical protein
MPGGDNMRHAVGNNAGLAAAGSCKDQDRSFGSLDCFSLLGVKAGKKIH